MTIKVKICGIRNLSSALATVSAGADFLGFIFVASSPRCIDVTTAFQIVNKLSVKVNTVGVFQNASTTTINSVAFKLNLDYVQLHGQEDNRLIKKIATPVIKTVFPKIASLPACVFFAFSADTILPYISLSASERLSYSASASASFP